MEMYANLHTHSIHSDGPYTPEEIVKVAKEEGYKAVAVTDHDSATAFPELKEACHKYGMDYIFGVEFCVLDPDDYHIVGFDFAPEYPPMKQYLADMGKRQTDNTRQCFNEAVALGNIKGITWEEILEDNKGVQNFYNNHVFRSMLKRGLVKQEEYRAWFDKNFKSQRFKYPPKINFKPLREVVKLIKEAGGIALVAHPHGKLDEIDFFIECGIEGIEVFHPQLDEAERERAYKIAIEKKLYISGGSDHSGLCGGFYNSYPKGTDIRTVRHYIEPLSAGTTENHFWEIKNRKLNR